MSLAAVNLPGAKPAPQTLRSTAHAICRNALSIDVEEYFHAEVFAGVLTPDDWPLMPRRAATYLEQIGELLARSESKATFFVLTWTLDQLAPLLQHLVRQGHEIACHGHAHQHLGRLDAEAFREDLRRSKGLIEDKLGVTPRGYRAPTFSLMRDTHWAADILIEEGFSYDASIFPIHHDRYGVPDAPSQPFWLSTASGGRLLEFPPMTMGFGNWRFPVGGGGYLRLLPCGWIEQCITHRTARDEAVMLYLHPWELDADQPRLPVSPLAQWRHRVNTAQTRAKLETLLQRFTFRSVWHVLQPYLLDKSLPEFSLTL
jgi:polysaccharide deacetylase family protein (PEP-CTERM system associated)